jgi:hypothetical protein
MLTQEEKMDRLLRRGIEHFGRGHDDSRGQIVYDRPGYDSFSMTGVFDVDPHLESTDQGKYYAVHLRLKDFDNAPFSASVFITFNNPPNSGNTVTLAGTTYTFRNGINNGTPNEVWKGVTGEDAAANLTAAINAGAGSGSLYSSITEPHPLCYATQLITVCRVAFRTPGTSGNGAKALENLNNATLSKTVFTGGGPMDNDLVTVDRLTYRINDIGYDPEGKVTLRLILKTTV